MDTTVLNIENKRLTLVEILANSNSKRAKLLYISDFISLLLNINNKQLFDSYILEFADTYFRLISEFDPFCIDPKLTKKIIDQANEILTYIEENEKHWYSESIKKIEGKFEKLKEYLAGKSDYNSAREIYFPLIEDNQNQPSHIKLNLIESVSVQLKKSSSKNIFNIIPSERELEKNIKHQVETSWLLAVQYIKKHIRKIAAHHNVVISFDTKSGIVQGNSVGAALTLAFIKELLQLYNSPVLFNIPAATAYTGGIDDNGNISPVSEKIITVKTEAIFFSGIQTFAVPREDESAAQLKLKELNEQFPNRKLKVIGINDFDDLLSRRNLLEIKKINPVIRVGKFALRNSLSFVLILVLAAVIVISGLIDFDNNPKVIKYENQHIKVLNANGKVLWSEKVGSLANHMLDGTLVKKQYAIITDLTGNGKNEVMLSNKLFGLKMFDPEFNNIICFDYAKKMVWKYTFAEAVSTNGVSFTSEYRTKFIDIYELNNRRILYVIAKNYYFPSAVFGVDIATGELATEVFWHSGHLNEGLIYKDTIKQRDKLILGGVNNGFESAALAVLSIDRLAGQAVAPPNYRLQDIPLADLIEYVLIPPSDYSFFNNSRYNYILQDHLLYEDKKLRVGTNEAASLGESIHLLYYYFNPDFSISLIEAGDGFIQHRDRLVKEGKLSPPLTYTAEYFDILKNNIKYWDGEKFVNHLQRLK